MTTTADDKENLFFDLAFGLAYFIHADRDVAFFVAEDALDALDATLSRHGKNAASSGRLRGFLKWGERARPVRRTVRLGEEQTLQWLVYKQSEEWERQTERGEGLYLPTEEDLIVRYVKHLVFIALRRGSFYVTLAVCSLLYQFNRRETRLFYDILTQSDSARMKDAGYVGKQRLEMIERVSRRFGDMVRTTNRPGEEKQFVSRPADAPVAELVHESLRRFAPWGADCAVRSGFDVTDIPGLYFSGSDAHEEEHIELSRMRAVIDPECFRLFAEGLSKYVRTLPASDLDKSCDYGSPDARLCVPLFSNYAGGPPRGDRLRPPELSPADYVRLRRTLGARARRRKDFSPKLLLIYLDGVHSHSLDLKVARHTLLRVGAGSSVVEMRGEDDQGELTLAILPLDGDLTLGSVFTGSFVLGRGQKLNVRLTPISEADGGSEDVKLEVRYDEGSTLRRAAYGLARLARRGRDDAWGLRTLSAERLRPFFGWPAKAVLSLLLVTTVSFFLWRHYKSPPAVREAKPAESARRPQPSPTGTMEREGTNNSTASAMPSPTPGRPPAIKESNAQVASAAWDVSRNASLSAIPVEATRGEEHAIDLSRREARVSLSVPRYGGEGRAYDLYRLTLYASGTRLWRRTLRAPKVGDERYAHILSLTLRTKRLPPPGACEIEIEGFGQGRWNRLGRVKFSAEKR